MNRVGVAASIVMLMALGAPLRGAAQDAADPCDRNHYILDPKCDAGHDGVAFGPTIAVKTSIGTPGGIVADDVGNVYFTSQNIVYKVDAEGMLTRVAGDGTPGFAGDGGPATSARLDFPASYPALVADPIDFDPVVAGLALDAAGNLYVADVFNDRIRRIDAAGIITTVLDAQIGGPQGVAVDGAGNLYVSAGDIVKRSPDGTVAHLTRVVCGPSFLEPGLCVPALIALDANGDLYAPDGYCRVRRLAPDGSVVTVAGDDRHPRRGWAFTCGYDGDGGPATLAAMGIADAVAVDADHNLYIADSENNCIRKVDTAGIIHPLAGWCAMSASTASVVLASPRGVAVDRMGNVLVADSGNRRILRIAPDGTVTTIAGMMPAPLWPVWP